MTRKERRTAGLTLLELAIVLAAVVVLIFIALPTLKPTEEEATIDFAKEQLRYLHVRETEYYNRHGQYAPLSVLAEDSYVGPTFDRRFAEDRVEVNGVIFDGPTREAAIYDIVATLPDGSRYRVDQTGRVVRME
jgi:Tfp pilus assembly protein PilE